MTAELFPVPESLSPKLKWLKKHGLVTWEIPPHSRDEHERYPWSCARAEHSGSGRIGPANCAIGETEHDAISSYCLMTGIKHWTVENP